MAIPPINLNELEYQQIFDNIKNYIKSKSDFSDFDFEGSALSSIIDVLAYNTHYHMLFQNILVNEMFVDSAQKLESLVSHAKLHGYTVQNRTAASATLTLSSIPTDSGAVAYSRMTAKKTDNTIVNFYNINDIIATTNSQGVGEATFIAYEAQRAVIDQKLDINIEKQSSFIPDSNMDIRTLRVFVDGVEYGRGNSTDSDVYENSNVYFLENVISGFDLIFASRIAGTKLDINSEVVVSYLVSSGESGNGASNFSFVRTPNIPTSATTSISGGSIGTATSSGGVSKVNIDELKLTIPRTFSSQNRIVTKSDVISSIQSRYGYDSKDIAVKADTKIPGKVWVRVSKPSDTSDAIPNTDDQDTLINYLTERAVIGVVYVYGSESGDGGSDGGSNGGSDGGSGSGSGTIAEAPVEIPSVTTVVPDNTGSGY